jgi:hypothetical protein
MNFWPTSNDYRPFWHCTHFAGMLYADSAATCASPSGPPVRSIPGGGCVKWERQPGADEEPGRPGGHPVLQSVPRLLQGPQPGTAVRLRAGVDHVPALGESTHTQVSPRSSVSLRLVQ